MAGISTRRRGSKWYYSFDAGTNPSSGRRKRVEKGGFETRQDAIDAGVKALASYLSGNLAITSKGISVRDYLEQWLSVKKMEVRPATAQSYATSAKIISAHLGGKTLQNLRPRDVNAFVLDLTRNGYAHGSISVIRNVLRSALNYAVYPLELLTNNPADYIKIPRNAPRHTVQRQIITPDQLNDIVSDVSTKPHNAIVLQIAYHTGMRLGEILGLTWDDVNFDKNEINVTRQLLHDPDHGYMFGRPKTETSTRTILIDDSLVRLLRRWRTRQAENEMKFGRNYLYIYKAPDETLWGYPKNQPPPAGMVRVNMVCCRERGYYVKHDSVKSMLYRHGLNSHSFRHTHATLCAEAGAPATGLAARLGHASTRTTEDIYTHVTDAMRADALAAFSRAVGKNGKM